MIFLSGKEFETYINKLVISITNNIKSQIPNVPNVKDKTTLFSKVATGAIVYDGFRFKGYFNDKILQELKDMGAIKDKEGYYVKLSNMPDELRKLVEKQRQSNFLLKKRVAEFLLGLSLTFFLYEKEIINAFSHSFLLKLKKNLKEDGLTTRLTDYEIAKKIDVKLTTGIKITLAHIAKHLLALKTNSFAGIVKYLHLELSKSIKDRIIHDINQLFFEIQGNICKDEGEMSFYWWHVPEKKPTDRMFHRKHFEASKRGKKFYFNNLPVWNGEPDFPGKLWNCRCRAYIDFKKFKQMI